MESKALDTRRDELLRSQASQVTTQQRLPSINIMGAAACLFEFSDTQATEREFQAVILNSHPRNILWDKDYGDPTINDDDKQPACVANDGENGQPRVGFAHLGLSANLGKKPGDSGLALATGVEIIPCASCPYNQFGSKRLITQKGNPRGKANTNYKSVYVSLSERELPFELRLPPTSITVFDKYLTDLINQGVPVQSVVTIFRQTKKEANGLKWAQVTLERGRSLTDDEFDTVLGKRGRYAFQINPRAPAPPEVVVTTEGDDGEEVPF